MGFLCGGTCGGFCADESDIWILGSGFDLEIRLCAQCAGCCPLCFPFLHEKYRHSGYIFISPGSTKKDPTQMANEPSSMQSSTAVRGGMTVDECNNMIQRSLRTPMVKFLKEHLEKSGCNIGGNFIKAIHCNKKVSGGYVRGEGIVVCSNHLNIQDEVNQVVIHELIHAYDDCRAANLDWSDCAHHACSEIRAGHLSGDCHYKRELLRGFVKLRGHEQDCVRRRVMKSVTANPYCSEVAAKDAMEAVWDVCYNDTKPFDRAP